MGYHRRNTRFARASRMESRIIFLGTGGDEVVVGKQLRASGGIILQLGQLQYHIDPGPGSLVRAVEHGINLRANTALFATCSNLIHCNDINAVISAMTYGGFDKQGVLVANNSIVNNSLTEHYKKYLEKIIVLNHGQRLGIEDTEIHALAANHTDKDTIGLKFITNDFVLSYSSDTSYSKALLKAYKDSDILILNVPLPGNEKKEGQLNTGDAEKIISEIKPKLAILTHFGVNMLKAGPLYESRQLQKQTNTQVLVAKDGMTINPISYAAKSSQKRLTGFSDNL